jgi:wyosine [tRNA(Phe)-imidazoG37] synthetase (radical SAM superfamily)
MEKMIQNFATVFRPEHILPLSGFSYDGTGKVDDVSDAVAIWPASRSILAADHYPHDDVVAASQCSILRIDDKPFLQCTLHFPAKRGWLAVYRDAVLIDQAELAEGWQHSAVALKETPVPSELTIQFLDHNREPVEGAQITSMFLSDDWGQGQRKRLKCYVPFTSINIFADFSVYPCCARQWLKPGLEAGNAKTDSAADLWNGPVYQKMRAEFLAGNYDATCRSDVCPLLHSEQTPPQPPVAVIHAVNEGLTQVDYGPHNLHHDIDYGCNLACTMCRNEKILPNAGNIDQALTDIKSVTELGNLEEISFSGAGEVFIMARVVKLLESDYFSSRGTKIDITSNLTHFNDKLWSRIQHNRFNVFVVSADGCSEKTYEHVRTGAKWATVERNMEFLSQLRQQNKIDFISWQYTVQKANVHDVAQAIVKARALGFDSIRLIAQMGALDRTNGNMFEDYDAQALDQLYEQIDSVDGFNDPRVILSELGIDNRRYRTVERRLELAEYIYDRTGFLGDSKQLAWHFNWQKCRHIVEGIIADRQSGAVSRKTPLPARHRDFVRRFLETAAAYQPPPITMRSLIRHPSQFIHLFRERAFQARVRALRG